MGGESDVALRNDCRQGAIGNLSAPMSSDLNSLGDRNVPASNPRIWTRFALRKLRPSVGGRSWVRQTISLRAPGGHSRVTHSRNQADTRGHRRTRRRSNSSTGGTARTPWDTRGHAIVPVRDREARVQIPGPRPVFEFRTVKCRYTASERRSRGVTGRSRRLPSVGPPCASRPVCEERARDAESGDHAARQKWTRIVDACER